MKPTKRFWSRMKAKIQNEFWAQCPRCHHRFGGHEKHGLNKKFVDPSGNVVSYRIVCHNCSQKALPDQR